MPNTRKAAARASKNAIARAKPRSSANTGFSNVRFDARPDRLDFRDLPYRPPLDSLSPFFPEQKHIKAYLLAYVRDKLIRDQGKEGSCTGFGLACVINYLLWVRHIKAERRTPFVSVSPHMLYDMARHYDEWPGEDYEGSSCRGALKGWHKHGVCAEHFWPNSTAEGGAIKKGWDADAVQRPLGVYYRVDKRSVIDMQAAIQDIGAIYVSARVHDGWDRVPVWPAPRSHSDIPLIPARSPKSDRVGGHAFAIVGYNDKGFIVQNSWGTRWGAGGFAVMSYGDWVAYGTDAWAVALGVPQALSSYRIASLRWPAPSGRSLGFFERDRRNPENPEDDPWPIDHEYLHKAYQPWSTAQAYEHTLVTGNDGRILVTDLSAGKSLDSFMQDLVIERPLEWFKRNKAQVLKLMIYAHGGLNSEQDSIARIRVLAPYFEANGIYPLFLTWRTGPFETIGQMLADKFRSFFGAEDEEQMRAAGFLDDLAEERDRRVEELAHRFLKGIWTEMRENAERSTREGRGLDQFAARLQLANEKLGPKRLQVHLMGHSAGSILLGHLLSELAATGSNTEQVRVDTCSLFAAACSSRFAIDKYLNVGKNVLDGRRIYLHYLTDKNEKADYLGGLKRLHLYGKSVLYLVSRALDDDRKIPLLGFERAVTSDWVKVPERDWRDQWSDKHVVHVKEWQARFVGKPVPVTDPNVPTTRTGKTRQATHGSFDNNIHVIGANIERIVNKKMAHPIEWLDY